jgi:hypothetical protein
MNKYTWKKIDPATYFSHVDIPDDWDTLEDFVDWYLDNKMPMMIPFNSEVIRSDDACAICVFRKGNYQVEFYLEYPQMWIRKHSHPRMEVIIMQLGAGGMSPSDYAGVAKHWGSLSIKLPAGDYHGGEPSLMLSDGAITLAFQRWENPEEITSAAIQWKGELQGPIQAELIRKHYPNALITEDYADVSVNVNSEQINK